MYRSEEGESFFTLSCQNKLIRCFWNIFNPPSTLHSVVVAFHYINMFCIIQLLHRLFRPRCISANHFSNHAAVFLIFACIFPTLQAAASVHLLDPSMKINFTKIRHMLAFVSSQRTFRSAVILDGCIDAIEKQNSRRCVQMKRWKAFN